MSIVGMNLRHLYQRRGFWLVWGFLGLLGIGGNAAALADGRRALSLAYIYVVFLAGLFVSALQVEIMSKPFSWCLPEHHEVPRRFLGWVCAGLGLLWAAVAAFMPAGRAGERGMVCVAMFFLSTMAYWLGTLIVSGCASWGIWISGSMLILVAGNIVDLDHIFEYVVIRGWWVTVAAGVVVNVIAWRHWGREGMGRRYCGRMLMGAFDAWNKEKMARFAKERRSKRNEVVVVREGVERFFLGRISNGDAARVGRYIWGNLYKVFGAALIRRNEWKRFFMVMVPVICLLGYLGPAINMMFLIAGLGVMHMKLGVHSNLLICGGRRERFWAGLVAGIAVAVNVTLVMGVIGGISVLLEQVMPAFTVRGQEVAYHCADMRLWFVPLVMIPVVLSFGLIFARYPRLMLGCVLVLFMIMMQIVMFLGMWSEKVGVRTVAFGVDWGVPALLLCCWVLFVGVLRHVCMRRCLIR